MITLNSTDHTNNSNILNGSLVCISGEDVANYPQELYNYTESVQALCKNLNDFSYLDTSQVPINKYFCYGQEILTVNFLAKETSKESWFKTEITINQDNINKLKNQSIYPRLLKILNDFCKEVGYDWVL